jgi:hypothetical protein
VLRREAPGPGALGRLRPRLALKKTREALPAV